MGLDYFREGMKHYMKNHKRERNQKVVAALAGISQPYMSQILKGVDDKGSFTTYDKIAAACGLTLEEILSTGRKLLEGDEPQPPPSPPKPTLPPELVEKLSALDPKAMKFLSACLDTYLAQAKTNSKPRRTL